MNCLRYRHPIYPAFWAHPRHGCYEVPAGATPRSFLAQLPGPAAGSPEEACTAGWLSAERWTGDRDFWKVRFERFECAAELLQLWATYIVERFCDENATTVSAHAQEGGCIEATIAEFATARFLHCIPRQAKFPGSAGVVLLEERKRFDTNCRQPSERGHHPIYPGFWIHPKKGTIELAPDAHHSRYFTEHPELFGPELGAAYIDGWVSIRRWVGYHEVWALRYDDFDPVAATLREWAGSVLARFPQELLTPLRSFPAAEAVRVRGTLGQLADGTARVDAAVSFPPAP